jgi:hypothetical protein
MFDDETFYPNITYGKDGLTFLRRCPKCMRFVKADASVLINWLTEEPREEPNATCSIHGRVKMPCMGWL